MMDLRPYIYSSARKRPHATHAVAASIILLLMITCSYSPVHSADKSGAAATPKEGRNNKTARRPQKQYRLALPETQIEVDYFDNEIASLANVLNKEAKNKVTIKGTRYLKYRNYGASGNSSEFEQREGLSQQGGRIEQGTDMT
ncbi:MAG TPA: hypothetical protein PLQ76_08710, partial [bacterium]|nr:hypothetical protein [bacterium]